jgi:PAS domain S-box-containing protein/putative nucleotidyltransferase with HDIG domain
MTNPLRHLRKRWLTSDQPEQLPESLQKTEAHLDVIIDDLPAFVYVVEVNRDGQWLYASPHLEALLGFEPRELEADPTLWFKRIHVEDRERVRAEWALCAKTGTPLHTEYRMLRHDGREIWVRNDATVTRATGQPDLLRGVVYDISDLKRTEQTLQREAEQLTALTRVSREIGSLSELPQVLASIARLAAELCRADASGVYTFHNTQLKIAASYGVSADFVSLLNAQGIAPGQGAIGRATVERRSIVIPDVQAEAQYPFADHARTENIRAVLATPMINGDQVTGGIVLWQRQPHYFSSRQISFLQAIAQQCTSVVESARRLQAEREQRILAETLRDAAAALNSTLDLEDILDRILQDIGRVVPHDAANIILVEGERARCARQRGNAEFGRAEPADAASFSIADYPGLVQMKQDNRPLVVPDTRNDPLGRSLPGGAWIRSYMGAPIQTQRRFIGFVNLGSTTAGFFDPAQAENLLAFANQAAIAIENARLLEEATNRADRLALLNRIARAANTTLELDDLLRNVHREISSLIASDAFFIALCDHATQELDFRILVDRGVLAPPKRHPIGSGLSGLVVSTRRPFLARNLEQEQDHLPPFCLLGTGEMPASWLGVPMLLNDQVIGVISAQSYRPNAYDDAEMELLSTIADTVAVAIDKARLFKEATRRARQLTVLNAAAIQVQQTFDSFTILRTACDQVQRLGIFAYVFVSNNAEQVELVHIAMGKETLREYAARFGERKVHLSVPLSAIQDEWDRLLAGETYIAPALGAHLLARLPPEDRLMGEWMLQQSQHDQLLVAPLTTKDATIGFIAINGDPLSEADIPAVALFARHVSVALDNARLFQEIQQELVERKRAEGQVQRQVQRLAALHSIDTAISSSLDLRVTLNIILEQVTSQLHVDAADILLFNPYLQMLQFAAGRGLRARVTSHTHLPLGVGYAGRAALERKTISVPNLAEATDELPVALRGNEEFVTYVALPLIAKGEVKGVLEVFHRSRLEYDQEWMDFLVTLAAQTAIAIDNMTLFDTLQRSNIELSLAYDTTLEGWSRALELRDRETEGHTLRVAELTTRLARAMGIKDSEIVHIRRGALLHDIGKMGIPDSILLKPGPLSEEEWEIMRKHPTYAYELLSPIAYLQPALDIPYCHHEKWDGTGYPRGLSREQIPLAARIFAVVDVWDALSSERPYRRAWSPDQTRKYILSISARHLDPNAVEAFMRLDKNQQKH